MPRSTLLLVAFFVGACTTSTAPPPARPDELVVPPVPASAEQPATKAPLPRHPAGEMTVENAGPSAAIGTACSEARSCGKSGRVAVVREQIRMRPAEKPPCQVVTTTQRNAFPNAAHACVDGPRVFIAVSCIACRLPTEDRFIGLVEDMTPAQLLEAQKLASLPAEPLLKTAQAWQQALAAFPR